MDRPLHRVACAALVCLAFAQAAAAQQDQPIGRFIADFRGAYGRHKVEPSVATDLGVESGNLPARSWGVAGGAHFYFWHTKHITFGVGGETVWARGSRTTDITNPDGTTSPGITVRRHFFTVVPELSLNFGHKNGWSYISGGAFGASTEYLDRTDLPSSNVPHRSTLSYGGGARWFTNERIAFAVDFHWYSVAPIDAGPTWVAEPRTTLLILSGGIAIR
jgi:opacity protein-like surface antigen